MIINKTPAAAAVVACLLAACNQPGFREGDPNRNRNTYALTGAAIGAAAGAIVGDGFETVAGTALGTAVGAAIGSRLDKQAAELESEIGGDGVTIENTGSELIVTMPQSILFDVDSTYVQENLRTDLVALAENLQRYPDSNVKVIGHTDNTGSASHNQDLSTRRAQSVSGIIMANGVAPARVTPVGMGEDDPIASNLTDDGRAQNRRVEVVIKPTETTG